MLYGWHGQCDWHCDDDDDGENMSECVTCICEVSLSVRGVCGGGFGFDVHDGGNED